MARKAKKRTLCEALAALSVRERLFFLSYIQSKTLAQCSKDAGYNCRDDNSHRTNGFKVKERIKEVIALWLEEIGLSDDYIKIRILAMVHAKETKFFAYQGVICDTREVDALDIQLRSLDMLARMNGLYAPTKIDATCGVITVVSSVDRGCDEP